VPSKFFFSTFGLRKSFLKKQVILLNQQKALNAASPGAEPAEKGCETNP
jgi:hypothetical protein